MKINKKSVISVELLIQCGIASTQARAINGSAMKGRLQRRQRCDDILAILKRKA